VQQLDLHRRERRQRAAQAGAQQRPAVGREREALLEPRDEPAERERPGDVHPERDPRPVAGLRRERLDERRAQHGAGEPAGEDGGQLTAVEADRAR
jgi:hypothetical protein